MNDMNDMQRILVEDHIHGLEHEAQRIRAERERDRRDEAPTPAATAQVVRQRVAATAGVDIAAISGAPVPASTFYAVAAGATDTDSPRVRLGRWLVSVGTAIAGTEAAEESMDGPCDDGPSSFSHAA